MFNKSSRKKSAPTPIMVNERWVCAGCISTKTHHGQSLFFRPPVTNANVYKGICIRCHPDLIPNELLLNLQEAKQQQQAPMIRTAAAAGDASTIPAAKDDDNHDDTTLDLSSVESSDPLAHIDDEALRRYKLDAIDDVASRVIDPPGLRVDRPFSQLLPVASPVQETTRCYQPNVSNSSADSVSSEAAVCFGQ